MFVSIYKCVCVLCLFVFVSVMCVCPSVFMCLCVFVCLTVDVCVFVCTVCVSFIYPDEDLLHTDILTDVHEWKHESILDNAALIIAHTHTHTHTHSLTLYQTHIHTHTHISVPYRVGGVCDQSQAR